MLPQKVNPRILLSVSAEAWLSTTAILARSTYWSKSWYYQIEGSMRISLLFLRTYWKAIKSLFENHIPGIVTYNSYKERGCRYSGIGRCLVLLVVKSPFWVVMLRSIESGVYYTSIRSNLEDYPLLQSKGMALFQFFCIFVEWRVFWHWHSVLKCGNYNIVRPLRNVLYFNYFTISLTSWNKFGQLQPYKYNDTKRYGKE